MSIENSKKIEIKCIKLEINIDRVEKLERKQTARITIQSLQNIMDDLKNSTPKESKEVSHMPVVNSQPKVGRNDPCPCGSGLKYKNCCGKS